MRRDDFRVTAGSVSREQVDERREVVGAPPPAPVRRWRRRLTKRGRRSSRCATAVRMAAENTGRLIERSAAGPAQTRTGTPATWGAEQEGQPEPLRCPAFLALAQQSFDSLKTKRIMLAMKAVQEPTGHKIDDKVRKVLCPPCKVKAVVDEWLGLWVAEPATNGKPVSARIAHPLSMNERPNHGDNCILGASECRIRVDEARLSP